MYYQLTMQFAPSGIDNIKKILDVANGEDVKELKSLEKDLGVKLDTETFPWEEEKNQKEKEPCDQVPPEVVKKSEEPKKITFDELKTAAHSYLDSHGHEELKELLKKYGSAKLSNVKEEQWPEILGDLSA